MLTLFDWRTTEAEIFKPTPEKHRRTAKSGLGNAYSSCKPFMLDTKSQQHQWLALRFVHGWWELPAHPLLLLLFYLTLFWKDDWSLLISPYSTRMCWYLGRTLVVDDSDHRRIWFFFFWKPCGLEIFFFKTPVRDERNYDKNCFDDQIARTTEGIKDPEGEGGGHKSFHRQKWRLRESWHRVTRAVWQQIASFPQLGSFCPIMYAGAWQSIFYS